MGKMLDTIDEAKRQSGHPSRLLDIHLATMKPADAADVRAALADPSYSSQQIARGLTSAGFKISNGAVHSYRQANA